MSAQVSKPSLGAGVSVAFVLSACGAALLAALTPWLGEAAALRTLVAMLGFSYTLYVMATSRERVGRLTTLAGWIALAAAGWLLGLPLPGYVLLHVGLVWLVRSLYHYSSLLAALADLALALLGTAFAVWAAQRSGAAWLALWCFFLVQAFHAFIPGSFGRRGRGVPTAPGDSFAQAHRAAEAAVRRLSSAPR
jgi:hypothetical protein